MAHENLLPALEKTIVLISRLRGLSRFQVSNPTLGLPIHELDSIIDIVGCLQLLAHRLLVVVGIEYRQFQAFSLWIRYEIDVQAADSSSSEVDERESNVDHASTLEYVQGAMMQSQLIQLFGLDKSQDQSSQWDLAAEGISIFELYKREYEHSDQESKSAKQLPGLDAIIDHLQSRCEIVFAQIADTQRRNVRFGAPIALGHGSSTIMDVRTLVEVFRSG